MKKNTIHTRRGSGRSSDVIKPALLTLAIAQALAFQAAQAANIEVTSNLDDGTDCTLREALTTVNAGADQLNGCIISGDVLGTNDTITFSPAVSGQTITTTQGELQITKDVSINPGGINTTIDANQASRVMSVISNDAPDLTATLNQLTITGGNTAGDGGGVFVSNSFTQQYEYNTVSLMLTNSTISGNTGGGIFVSGHLNESTNVRLTNSTVSDNSGIGIHAFKSSYADLTNSTVSDNSGGGLYAAYYSGFNLTNSTVSDNSGFNGGIRLIDSDADLTNSTVSGNSEGGGIYVVYSSISLVNTTVSSNSGGSGIRISSSGAGIRNSTISSNTGHLFGGLSVFSSSLSLANNIVAFNTTLDDNPGAEDCFASDYYGPVDIGAGPDTISTTVCGNATVADPLLGSLADNGGPTQTHALLAGSPAIDNATAADATASDQRGVAAVGVRDSGAYEFTAGIETMGKPGIDRSADTGIFIWESQPNDWISHVVSGDQQRIVEVDVNSSESISNVQQVNIEASDLFTVLPNGLDLSLNVKAPWLDGFKFTEASQASTCVSTTNADVPIYVGPNRVEVGNTIDLNTLTACEPDPDIETIGKPNIDRSTDTGIFIWESQPNNWVSHVVSGDMQRTVEVDVNSSESLNNVQEINIEASDVFTILPNGLDLSLNVKAPWLDGFKFTEPLQAETCVSTTNNDVPIYVGPNRVQVGNSLNLKTLTSCP